MRLPFLRSTHPSLLRASLALLALCAACGDNDETSATGEACAVGSDTPRCDGLILETCDGSSWQQISCDVICSQATGTAAIGCGPIAGTTFMQCLCEPIDDSGTGGSNSSGGSSGSNTSGSSGGSSGSNTSGSSSSTGGPTCQDVGESCLSSAECCGSDMICVNDGQSATCTHSCVTDSECASGCCADLQRGGGACAPSSYCPDDECSPTGETCATNGDCCRYPSGDDLCVNFGSNNVRCAAICFLNSDCSSGCCVELKDGGGACGPASFCGGAPDETDDDLACFAVDGFDRH